MTLGVLLTAGAAQAVSPMWVRDAKLSPDGRKIVFSYKGDLFTVPFEGGDAVRLTSGEAYECAPVWSPDGSSIAFASDRNGGRDIYLIPSGGGTPRRLTSNSASEIPQAFTPDGKEVLFSAMIQDPASSALAPMGANSELYAVAVDGGYVRQVLAVPAVGLAMRPDGSFLYEDIKGIEDKWRKHHTSSVTRDIWLYDNGKYINLTSRQGEDRSPALSVDGNSYYFLSERDGGSFNVYSSAAVPGAPVKKLTDFKDHPVRFLSSGAGDRLAFVYNGELYTMIPGGAPHKLAVDLLDDKIQDVLDIPFRNVQGAVVSPDGKQMAFTVRGEVFVASTEYPSVKQITHTPAIESRIAWGADGRSLYYGSLRSGRSNIYKASISRKDDPNFSNATLIDEKAMFPDDGVERGWPSVSPDGKKMAYVEDRRILKVMDLASGSVKTLSADKVTNSRGGGYEVAWSPDSRWLTLVIMNPMHDPYGDIAIINVEDGELVPLTNTGYFDEGPRFTPDGNAVIFGSERYGMRNHASWGSEYDVMMVFLNKEAFDKYRLSEEDYALLKEVEEQQKKNASKDTPSKGKKDGKGKNKKKDEGKDASDKKDAVVKIDREGIMDRIVRLTPNSSDLGDFVITKDGADLYYLSAFEGGYDLWKKTLRKGDVSLVKKIGAGGSIQTDKDGNIYIAGSTVRKFNPKSKELKTLSVSGNVKIDPVAERDAMLDYVANEARERFYLPEMPVDWDMYVANYRRFLPHISNGYDFADLLSELLGELNVSHSGGRYYSRGASDQTASLGLLFDVTGRDNGTRIEEVVAGGPFDRATSRVRPGDIVEAVNGEKTAGAGDWSRLLNNTAKKKTLVSLFRPSTGERWEEVVLPVGSGVMSELMYRRWIKSREAAVDSLSGGRLGYVHLRSMTDDSFREIYSNLLGKYYGKEGIVIDTRWNGGGRLHEDIEVLFSGEKYLTQEIHGRPSGEMPSRRWNKPSIMIIGEANYSNAHGTPWVYRYKKMGKLVGMPVPGTMSSVNWITLQDPSLVFGVPVVAFRTAEGNVLENTQLEPDIKVANLPADVVRGRDAQLETAVRTLLEDIDRR